MKIPGVKEFMAMEVGLDLIACRPGWVTDIGDWSPVGPGAKSGAGWIFGHHFANVTNEELRQILTGLRAIDPAFATWELHHVQFLMCEINKFTRGGGNRTPYFPQGMSPQEMVLHSQLVVAKKSLMERDEEICQLRKKLREAGVEGSC